MTAATNQTAITKAITANAMEEVLNSDPSNGAPFKQDREIFDCRYFAYLKAKAALADPDAPEDDEERGLLYSALDLAEMILIATPAAVPHQSLIKLKIFEEAVIENIQHGEETGPRVLLAIASFKRDLAAFNFGD